MSLLSNFEKRLERTVEGFFSRVFRSGVHPVEIGKRIQRVMEEGKAVALRRTYVPHGYQIVLSNNDHKRLAPMESKIAEELEIFISENARQREWVLADTPRVTFLSDKRLSPGEFRVDSEEMSLESAATRRRKVAPVPAARPGKPSLVVLDADATPLRTIPLDETIRIGRQPGNQLVLPDQTISREHAEIDDSSGNGLWVIRDLGSHNGTVVNGERVQGEQRLHDGDRIVIGSTLLEFRRS